jgi:hypothetical protein
MSRSLSAEQLIEIASHAQMNFELLEVEWSVPGQSTVYFRFTNAPWEITTQGKTWTALGDFLSFDGLEEQSDFAIQSINIALSGSNELFNSTADGTLTKFFNDNYIDRPIRIYRVFYDSNRMIVGAPILIFDGRMNKPTISTDPANGTIVAVECSSQWADFERRNYRATNDEGQRYYTKVVLGQASEDRGFEFAHITTKDLRWGG